MIRIVSCLVGCGLICPSSAVLAAEPAGYDESPAPPADWQRTFSTLAESCLRLPPTVTVVGAGEECATASAAASALAQAVSRTNPGGAVKGLEQPDQACALYDPEIVQQASGPVLIVRGLGADSGPQRVAVSFYAASGAPQVALIAEAGVPLTSCAETERVERELRLRGLRIQEPGANGGRLKIYQGRSSTPLAPAPLFELTGRRDLLERYRKETRSTAILALVGLGIVVGGSVLWYAKSDSCSSCDPDGWEVLGVLSILVGGSMVWGALSSSADPTDDEEKRKLVDEYNLRLRQQLTSSPARTVAAPRWNVSPAVGRDGGALTVGLRF